MYRGACFLYITGLPRKRRDRGLEASGRTDPQSGLVVDPHVTHHKD